MAIVYKKAAAQASSEDTLFDGIIIFGDPRSLRGKHIPGVLSKGAAGRAKQIASKADLGTYLAFDRDAACRVVVVTPWPEAGSRFRWLSLARGVVAEFKSVAAQQVLLDLRGLPQAVLEAVVDAVVSAVAMHHWEQPVYGKKAKSKDPKFAPTLNIIGDDEAWQNAAKGAAFVAEGTNLARRLTVMPTNELNCKSYIKLAREVAKNEGLSVTVYTQGQLEKKGAGAFCAVARGSSHQDAGIVKLGYVPAGKKKTKTYAVVGKGIVYDTGGVNVKTGNSMFGMHGDMAGSAVALATILVAAREKWPVAVTAYLAIAENAIGDRAFLPNEVVTALDGTSIEIVHTDAEGRMALADTLHLASQDNPDFILDFATLTGSAVRAIGTMRSVAFANNEDLHPKIIAASHASGERVWPLPYDHHDAEALKSDIADTKQCKLVGAVDHIEAACFLNRFVKSTIPWVHIDLAAAEHEGGLAHVPTTVTGFGVRFARRLILDVID